MCKTQCGLSTLQANMRRRPIAGPMLAHRLRRGPASNQHWFNTSCLLGLCSIERWFGSANLLGSAYCWWQVQADTDPMYVKCWASDADVGQCPFSPSQYFILAAPAYWRYRHDALNQSWVNVGPPSVTLAHIQRSSLS